MNEQVCGYCLPSLTVKIKGINYDQQLLYISDLIFLIIYLVQSLIVDVGNRSSFFIYYNTVGHKISGYYQVSYR